MQWEEHRFIESQDDVKRLYEQDGMIVLDHLAPPRWAAALPAPVVEMDGMRMVQVGAIARYIACKYDMAGTSPEQVFKSVATLKLISHGLLLQFELKEQPMGY